MERMNVPRDRGSLSRRTRTQYRDTYPISRRTRRSYRSSSYTAMVFAMTTRSSNSRSALSCAARTSRFAPYPLHVHRRPFARMHLDMVDRCCAHTLVVAVRRRQRITNDDSESRYATLTKMTIQAPIQSFRDAGAACGGLNSDTQQLSLRPTCTVSLSSAVVKYVEDTHDASGSQQRGKQCPCEAQGRSQHAAIDWSHA